MWKNFRKFAKDRAIEYSVRRSGKAKYIRIQVREGKVELILPARGAVSEGERFLNSKRDWIQKKLDAHKESDERYFYLGNEVVIERVFEENISKNIIKFNQNVLTIKSPRTSKISDRALYDKWLKVKGQEHIPRRTEILAETDCFRVKKISIRNQKTRWGSCSASGALSFNYKLMQFREDVIDYVIIHELCHLLEMNHSRKFWNLVEAIMPDYKSLRKELKLFNRTKKEE